MSHSDHVSVGLRLRAVLRRCSVTGAWAGLCLGLASVGHAQAAAGVDQLFSHGAQGHSEAQFLSPDQAFRLQAAAAGSDAVQLHWRIAEGYYLYRNRIKVASGDPRLQLGATQLPQGENKTDEYFGTQQVYHQDLTATVPLATPAGGSARQVSLTVTYQGCATAGLCYPPQTKQLSVNLPGGSGGAGAAAGGSAAAAGTAGAGAAGAGAAAPAAHAAFVSEQDRYANVIRDGRMAWVIAFFFGLGLLLSFTPCVLPMVPIVLGIIMGGGHRVTAGRAFVLSFAYVLGMAASYTAAGIAVAAGGRHVQAAFQQPWIIGLFAALFVVMALSMFGLFTVQMPSAVQTRLAQLSNRQSAGSVGGVAVMGMLSALIVTTCVAPPLVGTLIYIGQSGNMLRGGLALFAMGLGMGAPLVVVATSGGRLMPKAGPWMDTVKRLFGAMMLGVAVWMLARIVPERASLALWAVPAIAIAGVLWLSGPALGRTRAPLRAAAAAAGAYALVLLAGAALGGTDPLAPLPGLGGPRQELAFRTIKSVDDLDREVRAAHAQGRPVMLDFYADWCVSCKEMAKYTFTDPQVQATLGRAVLLRADVTRNDSEDQALLKRFGIFGPPTIAFYGIDGTEQRSYRVVGFMKAPEFASLAQVALGAHPQVALDGHAGAS